MSENTHPTTNGKALEPALVSYDFTNGQTPSHLVHTIRTVNHSVVSPTSTSTSTNTTTTTNPPMLDTSTDNRRVPIKDLPDGSLNPIPSSTLPSSSSSPTVLPTGPSTDPVVPSLQPTKTVPLTSPSPARENSVGLASASTSTSSPMKQKEPSSSMPAPESIDPSSVASSSPRKLDKNYSTATNTIPKKKKKKAFSFASFLSCLSTNDRDYDGARQQPSSSGSSHPNKPSSSVPPTNLTTNASSSALSPSADLVVPTAASAAVEPSLVPGSEPSDLGSQSNSPAPAALPSLVGSPSTTEIDPSQVVVPSPIPTTAPLEETEGLTSSSVVPPGFDPTAHSNAHSHQQNHSHNYNHNRRRPSASSTSSARSSSSSSQHPHQSTAYTYPHHHSTRPSTPSPPAGILATSSSASDSFAGTDSDDGKRYDSSDVDRDPETEIDRSEGEGDLEGEGDGGILLDDDDESDDDIGLLGGIGIPLGPDGEPRPLLPPLGSHHKGRKCLVLDLDETLLHSSFKMIPHADYIVPVEIESQVHNVYVIKRPGVDTFLKKMGEVYEVVVFTASLSKYADPVLDILDIHHVVAHRLFRESCYNHKGNYVKDLSQLGRPIEETIIIDNSPASYLFHPNNAVPVSTWFNDPHDSELSDLVMFLEDLSDVPDVRGVLDGGI